MHSDEKKNIAKWKFISSLAHLSPFLFHTWYYCPVFFYRFSLWAGFLLVLACSPSYSYAWCVYNGEMKLIHKFARKGTAVYIYAWDMIHMILFRFGWCKRYLCTATIHHPRGKRSLILTHRSMIEWNELTSESLFSWYNVKLRSG